MDQEQWEQRLAHRARIDPCYRQLLEQCEAAEADYLRIRSALPPEDQEALDRYISLCEELGYRLTSLALQQNREEKKMDGC